MTKEIMNTKNSKYLSSKETKKALKISGCKLMHLREDGKIEYVKKGNAYLYLNTSIDEIS
ncbi:hypothetical protein GCM10022258_29090 [Aquimarina gracilis]